MHIYFSGIGGAGIGPLAQIALDAGYKVSGSDKQNSSYIDYLRKHGVKDIHISQTKDTIEKVHSSSPIDWFVYSSALTLENPNAPEIAFCRDNKIKVSKRDELINQIIRDKKLKLIAIAGTHGKTTTTAMVVYLFTKLKLSASYLLPAKTSFAEMGKYAEHSDYFIYEADEFDRNFLSFEPNISLITGVSWDHHEIFPDREDYQDAFKEFINQSRQTYIWQEDAQYLGLNQSEGVVILNSSDPNIEKISLAGLYNRLDAWLAIEAVYKISGESQDRLIKLINSFPGLSRRMEKIAENIYSDYAHTPEKIRGAMSVAGEMVQRDRKKGLVVVYEPLTDRRQHFIKHDYTDSFEGADKLYWLPSYLAREDPNQEILSPEELIRHLANPKLAEAAEKGEDLKKAITNYAGQDYMVVCMAGGGGGSLDDWVRKEFS